MSALVDDRMLKYNALDGATTMQVYRDFPFDSQFAESEDWTMRMFGPLQYMMTRGILVNVVGLSELQRHLREELGNKERELSESAGRKLNALSPKDCATYFYVERGYDPYFSKKKKDGTGGGVTTDDKALQRLVRKYNSREARLVQDIRGLNKLLSNYVEMQFDSDNRFRSAYNPRGTTSGRLSSSKTVFGTGGNAQNLDPAFKQYLIADPGYCLLEVDKRQAEWVVVAYLTGDANMIKVVESGEDTHTYTAARMFGVPEAVVLHDHKLVGSYTDPDVILDIRMSDPVMRSALELGVQMPRTMSMRQAGKKSNHGLNYDEGYTTFSLSNEMPENEGKRIISLYHGLYTGIRQWYEFVKRQLQADRTLRNCFGRPRIFLGAWDDNLWKAAYAYLPQSTVVDGLNRGMCFIYEDPVLDLIQLLAQVHDSLLMQYPIDKLPQLYKTMKVIYDHVTPQMEYGGRPFKIATDMKLGLNWGKIGKSNPLGMVELSLDVPEEQFNQRVIEVSNGWQTS
jgi:DNA polymerase I-like protein with 3'-5' exonuclease and polymerase domains